MPPKRRRRKSGTHKQPLHFMESPLHLVHKLPSPVFPCDHPAQAEVIPAELGTSVWVSPQFRNVPPSGVKTRRSRHRTGQRRVSGGEDDEGHHSRVQGAHVKKYEPLQMLGETKDNSTCENIEDYNNSPKRRTRSRGRNSSNRDKNAPVQEVSISELNQNATEHNQDAANLGDENDSERKFTQVRPKEGRKTKRSKLNFSKSGSDLELNCSPERPKVNGTPLGNHDSFINTQYHNVHTPNNTYPSLPTNEEKLNNSTHREKPIFSRLLDETKLSGSDSSDERPDVLVYDTPESEYGKGIRWRQLHRRKTRSDTKNRHS